MHLQSEDGSIRSKTETPAPTGNALTSPNVLQRESRLSTYNSSNRGQAIIPASPMLMHPSKQGSVRSRHSAKADGSDTSTYYSAFDFLFVSIAQSFALDAVKLNMFKFIAKTCGKMVIKCTW